MSDQDDLQRIGGSIDADGDEVPQEHPIENPGENGDDTDDAIAEPHPQEPGPPDACDDKTSMLSL